MTNSGKNVFAIKVFDHNCDVCQHMSKHDRVTFESFEDIGYQEILLDDVINHQNNLTKLRVYQLLEKYALNSDYTVDLPAYLLITPKGEYKSHHVGAATIVELRDKIQSVLEAETE